MVALLGANGAGKTTTLRAVSGTVRKTGARPLRRPRRLALQPRAAREARHRARPGGARDHRELTVWENLRLGAYVAARPRRSSRTSTACRELFPWLAERRDQQAGTLSGGEQQMLALARALVARPRLLMLDEPSLGLAPLVVQELFRVVRQLNEEEGLTVLVVEQNAAIALERLAPRLRPRGRARRRGGRERRAARSDEGVRTAYLGY